MSDPGFSEWLADYLATQVDSVLVAWSSDKLLAKAREALEAGGEAPAVSTRDDRVEVAAAGSTVTLDREGLPGSHCTCPAPRVCKHRLMAALVLRRRFAGEQNTAGGTSVLDDVDEDSARAAFGAKRWNVARRAVLEGLQIDLAATSVLDITLRELDIRCSFIPGVGLPGSVCSCKRAFPCDHRAMAVAAHLAQRGHLSGAEAVGHATLSWTPESLVDAVTALLERVAAIGLEHTTTLWSREALRFAVGAHTVGWPQVERELESIAAELASARRVNPARAGALLARNHLRLAHLRDGGASDLAGAFRRTYVGAGSLDLACIGASPVAAGAGLGVVLYFFDGKSILTHHVHVGSRGPDLGTRQNPWQRRGGRDKPLWGTVRWREALGHRMHLARARRTVDGRLSGTSKTTAALLEPFSPAALQWKELRVRDWGALVARSLRPYTLDALVPSEYAVVAPTRWGELSWDSHGEALCWDVFDSSDRALRCRLPLRPKPDLRVDHAALEVATRRPASIFGRLAHRGAMLEIEPLVLFNDASRREPIVALGLPDKMPPPAHPEGLPALPRGTAQVNALLGGTRRWLHNALLGGVERLTASQRQRAHELAGALRAAGAPTLADHLQAAIADALGFYGAWHAARVASDVAAETALRRAYELSSRESVS